MLSINYR